MEPDGPVRGKSGHKDICQRTCITQGESCYDMCTKFYCIYIYIYLSE